jgi:hypothetical protein
MMDFLFLILMMAAYFALLKWVAPRFGVPT